ncbi:MAG: glucosamine 6-phosphate synthetase [Flavobacteriales bacterium]|nr:glucosamine 6-phosphate synthetase [Flavobacteriales bacterium]
MCGIFGAFTIRSINKNLIKKLAIHSEQRGIDSSGICFIQNSNFKVVKADFRLKKLLKKYEIKSTSLIAGHSRLVTDGMEDNQPVVSENVVVLHNGIIVNHDQIWHRINRERKLEIDTEIINALVEEYLDSNLEIENLPRLLLSRFKGVVSAAIFLPKRGKLILISNNGSLYTSIRNGINFFASEKFALTSIGCQKIYQVVGSRIFDLKEKANSISVKNIITKKRNLIPNLNLKSPEAKILEFITPNLKRCKKCVLPETMPFIKFDINGFCNYCNNYKKRNQPKPFKDLYSLVEPYRKKDGESEVIVPFSGGRDSCFSLHLIVKELGLKPITYTYDWGMVTDLGRRNISRMSAELGVENIIVSADIHQKRDNIRKNVKAWLDAPHLGLISLFTAGDKHFFRHVETIKKQTGVSLNLWGINPLEVTHFKNGFLGIPPDFHEEHVYLNGIQKQLRYHKLRFKAMTSNLSYFNNSLWDTLSGEYFRSFKKKTDYFHVFDYWKWDENEVNKTLGKYDWEIAPDTNTTWRIGDGTAAFYNYIYYRIAGFTEHDTFRSNQIREGQITREQAIKFVEDENQPRYANLKWYLDTINLDFEDTIKVINSIPKIY